MSSGRLGRFRAMEKLLVLALIAVIGVVAWPKHLNTRKN